MLSEIGSISMPMAALLASLIGATATITASLLQLRMAWRKELQARAAHKPVNKKAKRGPIFPIAILVVASAISGFALSQYFVSEGRSNAQALESDLRARIDQLTLSAQRLDSIRQGDKEALVRQARYEEAVRNGKQGIASTLAIDKCIAAQSNQEGTAAACSEQQALQLQLCSEIPASASVTGLDLYALPKGDQRTWPDAKVVAGGDFGGGRFNEHYSERLIDESSKQVCEQLSYWNSTAGVVTRMVIHYVPQQPAEVTIQE
jgi:hypothetical protein